jgi:hypothetical protein
MASERAGRDPRLPLVPSTEQRRRIRAAHQAAVNQDRLTVWRQGEVVVPKDELNMVAHTLCIPVLRESLIDLEQIIERMTSRK